MMLTVVWDVDDVLNDLMYQWFVYAWLPEHSNCRITYAGLTCNPPHDVLGVERTEYLSSMDVFRRTERACKMAPNPEVLEWFREQGHGFRHIALTARPLETAPDVAHWVMLHFGAWIRCFGVVPTRLEEGIPAYDCNKREFLEWLGRGDVLVDDSTDNILQAESLGMKTLQAAQPWNQSRLTISALLRRLSQMAGES
jgi:hypothetical protein